MLTLSASSMQARMHHKQQPQATETMVADTAAGLEAVSDTVGSLDEILGPMLLWTQPQWMTIITATTITSTKP